MEGKRSRVHGRVADQWLPRCLAVTLAAVLGLAPPAARGGYTAVVENGPASNRVNIVLLGDGYTASEIDTAYTEHIEAVLAHVFAEGEEPFQRYANFFNVYRVDLISAESGADVPPLGIYRDTALDASYCYNGGPERLLYVNQAKADAAVSAALDGSGIYSHLRWVLVNDTRYGGAGGQYAVFAGGNTYAGELALHESGHSFSGLADEYVDSSYGSAVYTGPEPLEVNITADPSGAKWSHWLGYTDSLGVVDAYEGAGYYAYGLYRPTPTSKMKTLGQPFNAICREKIIQDIYNLVYPLDGRLSGYGVLVDPEELWVDVIDPNVLEIEWYVEGSLVPGASGETFRLEDYGYGPGLYGVYAHVFDATEWVRIDLLRMHQYAGWTVELTPEPASLSVILVGTGLLLRRRRR